MGVVNVTRNITKEAPWWRLRANMNTLNITKRGYAYMVQSKLRKVNAYDIFFKIIFFFNVLDIVPISFISSKIILVSQNLQESD